MSPIQPMSRLGLALAGVLAATLAAGCGGTAGGPPADPPTPVVTGAVTTAPVEDVLAAIGTVEANEQVTLTAEAAGTITAIRFTEGGRVAAGDVLFTLDAAKEEAALAQARAEEEVAQQNLERARKLAGTRAISEQELDQLTSLLTARTAARQLQEERWRDMTISAPFAGTVGPRQVSVGQYVSPGQPLLLLVDAAQVKTSFRVPERHLAQLRVGQAVRLVVGAYTGRTFDGAIDLISPVVDEATRTVQVRAVVPNPEALLKPGMFARVEAILGQRPAALVIPEAALVAALDGFSVFVVADGRARLVPVQVGVRNRGTAEVREGLAAGQPIVVQGTQKLVDGMLVVAAAAGGTNGAAVTP